MRGPEGVGPHATLMVLETRAHAVLVYDLLR